jgi:hypothetical protein
MLLPRFTLRTFLALTTACALFFVLVGAGYRGQAWAWGAAIGIASLAMSLLVQAVLFGLVWCSARLSTARPANPTAAPGAIGAEASP